MHREPVRKYRAKRLHTAGDQLVEMSCGHRKSSGKVSDTDLWIRKLLLNTE